MTTDYDETKALIERLRWEANNRGLPPFDGSKLFAQCADALDLYYTQYIDVDDALRIALKDDYVGMLRERVERLAAQRDEYKALWETVSGLPVADIIHERDEVRAERDSQQQRAEGAELDAYRFKVELANVMLRLRAVAGDIESALAAKEKP